MKRCYYELLDVDRKATTAEIKTVRIILARPIANSHSNITPIKIQMKTQNINLYKSMKPILYSQIPMKEHGTITIEKKY